MALSPRAKKKKQLFRTYRWLDRHATRWASHRFTGLVGGCRGARYRWGVAMHGPDEDDVVEQGGPPLRLPAWARRPRWVPALRGRLSRGAALFGLVTLIVGLAAGYALGDRHSGQPSRPTPSAASAPSAPGADDLFGLAQTGERPNRHRAASGVP
jgi:hypothetical protein